MYHKGFDKADTTLLKGCSILLLLFHHLFLDESRYKGFTISFYPFAEKFIVNTADMLKICVSLFTFVSGYGLLLSYKKVQRSRRQTVIWTAQRLVKLIMPFFFCYVVSLGVYIIYMKGDLSVYFSGKILQGVAYLLLDATGMSCLFGTPILCSTWWYMSAAILFSALVPLICLIANKRGYFALCFFSMAIPRLWGSGYPGGTNPVAFLLPFLFGMMAADYRIFDRFDVKLFQKNHAWGKLLLLCAAGIVATYYLNVSLPRKEFWDFEFGLVPIVWLLFFNYIIGGITFLRKPLIFLGNHSMTIFLTHTFIRSHFARDLIYSCGHFMLIYIVLLVSSLLVALLIDWIRGIIGYDQLTKRITAKIASFDT